MILKESGGPGPPLFLFAADDGGVSGRLCFRFCSAKECPSASKMCRSPASAVKPQRRAALDLGIARQLGHQRQVGAADVDIDQLHLAELLDIVDRAFEQIILAGGDDAGPPAARRS